MIIGGFQRFSLIDYPGKICAIIFTQGCNFRCPYCHNPELVDMERSPGFIPEEEILSFLKKRSGKLDAVEITGGEPTLQPDLLEFLQKIKDMGYLIKLDSNGTSPKILEQAINNNLVDYLAMDIKAPLRKYEEVVNARVNTDKIKYSIDLIENSRLSYEFRTTIVKSLLSKEDIIEIGKLIKGAGIYILQKFVPSKTLNPEFLNEDTYSDIEFEKIGEELKNQGIRRCTVR